MFIDGSLSDISDQLVGIIEEIEESESQKTALALARSLRLKLESTNIGDLSFPED